MTLGQMARKTDAGPGIACCNVKDWPAFPYRIIQYDIARGQSVDVEYVKRMIRALARCKINGLLFYMEDDFRFRTFPFLGREGTFTHEKARELTEYARPYHMQLIPQFEALGHASAVLRHPEMEKMREAGDPWVFCTSEPETWKFLDTVFAELVEAFPTTEFIHTGADEFEFGFAKCPQCKAKVDASGMGALYAEHMNKLNQLVKKHGRTMMFWPSHHGPTPELSDMTLKYSDQMEKDCIPTEWIYHGPAEYPTLKQYQQAGFKDVHCCPAVVSYSVIWPDYETTMRGIRGFYRAGAEERGGLRRGVLHNLGVYARGAHRKQHVWPSVRCRLLLEPAQHEYRRVRPALRGPVARDKRAGGARPCCAGPAPTGGAHRRGGNVAQLAPHHGHALDSPARCDAGIRPEDSGCGGQCRRAHRGNAGGPEQGEATG